VAFLVHFSIQFIAILTRKYFEMVCASARPQKNVLAHRKKTQKEVDEEAVFEERYGNLMNDTAMEKGFSVSYNLVDYKKAAD
jgi:hypothetical protein